MSLTMSNLEYSSSSKVPIPVKASLFNQIALPTMDSPMSFCPPWTRVPIKSAVPPTKPPSICLSLHLIKSSVI